MFGFEIGERMDKKVVCDFENLQVGDSSNSSEDVETSVGKSREERLQMYMDSITDLGKRLFGPDDEEVDEDGCHEMTLREYCSHELDKIENGGFDIEDYSKVSDPGMLIRFYYPPEKPTNERFRTELADCSRLALEDYNHKENTHYTFASVVKANLEPCSPYTYYITFEATDENNNTQTFQARVDVCFPGMEKVVELVQIKTAPKPMLITRPRKLSHGV